jgi:exodeoxyribonuclease-5
MVDLTFEQEQAFDLAMQAVRARVPVFKIFGPAGTGKTTLSRMFLQEFPGIVHAASFTGKASHVMRTKGLHGAQTIHSLIYKPLPNSPLEIKELQEKLDMARAQGEHKRVEIIEDQLRHLNEKHKPAFVLNEDSVLADYSEPRMLVVDEVSMVDEFMARDLLSFGVPIVCFGDPGQLPPIRGAGFFAHDPDFMLTEIHRQAKGNPILQLATQAREGRMLDIDNTDDVKVIHRSQLDPEEIMSAGQLLVGKNKTRHMWNQRYRQRLGFTDILHEDERVICRRNDKELGIFNGSQWLVKEWANVDRYKVEATIDGLDVEHKVPDVPMHRDPFFGKSPVIKMAAQEFEYAYAITVHVSQGSQWDHVVLLDESGCFRDNASKWLYTGITRAAKKLTVVYE